MKHVIELILDKLHAITHGVMSDAEVKSALSDLAARHAGERLDYEHSIVDLLKLLGEDSSLDARKRLAAEVGYQGPLDGSAEMNTLLHKETMQAVAERYIKV